MSQSNDRLVCIPSDPLDAYVKKGITKRIFRDNYYNPLNSYKKLFLVSPLEPKGVRSIGDITVVGVDNSTLIETLQNINPNLVRGYGGYWACDYAIYSTILALPNTPVYISVHDSNPYILHESIVYADRVQCTSKIVQDLVISRGVKKEKTFIVPDWINMDIFKKYTDKEPEFIQSIKKRGFSKIILHVGRKAVQKNLETVIKSMKLLPDDYVTIFIGAGDDTYYKNLAQYLGVHERCFWISSVSNEELPYWYSVCDVMCTPSRWEGFGDVFMEAAACSCNIITSDIAPMNELFINNETALLVKDFENEYEIAIGILKFQNKDFAKKISTNARHIAEKYDMRVIQKYEANLMRETSCDSEKLIYISQIRDKAIHFFQTLYK